MNGLFHRISEQLPGHLAHADPAFRAATDGAHTAWNLAYDTPVPYFGADGWLTRDPAEALKFGLAMGAVGPTSDPGVAADFPWEALAKGKDAVVDVGGGQGTLCCSLAAKYPGIKAFVVQDLPETRDAAESFIKGKGLQERVKFEAQDFFTPQQRKGKYLFVMQRVLHDWSTADGARMLAHIRDVLNKDVRNLSRRRAWAVQLTGPPAELAPHHRHRHPAGRDQHQRARARGLALAGEQGRVRAGAAAAVRARGFRRREPDPAPDQRGADGDVQRVRAHAAAAHGDGRAGRLEGEEGARDAVSVFCAWVFCWGDVLIFFCVAVDGRRSRRWCLRRGGSILAISYHMCIFA